MDSVQNKTAPVYISEYDEAEERFHQFSENEKPSTSSHSAKNVAEELVNKLCQGDKHFTDLDIGHDSSLFYQVIHHADYIQIKSSLVPNFYTELCNIFILSDLIGDIVANVNQLDKISHVKILLAQGFFCALQIEPVIENDWLLLKYAKEKTWSNIDFTVIHNVRICPPAFKVLLTNNKFNLTCLNFLLKLLDVKELSLYRCNLNGRDTADLFKDLELKCLNLNECGTIINSIIQDNIPGVFTHLMHLDVSNIVLLNETLQIISSLSLRILKICNCIKQGGHLVNSTYFTEKFRLNIESEILEVNIDLLWSKGGMLRETLEVLDVSFNNLTTENLINISQLNLIELDITECLTSKNTQHFSKICFPDCLKILRAMKNTFMFSDFEKICSSKLERLELSYKAADSDNFSSLSHSQLVSTLKELSVIFSEPSQAFIDFISKIQLTHLYCDFETADDNVIDPFIADYPEERKCLESFKIHGPGLELTDKFLLQLKNLDLREMSVSLACSDKTFSTFLSCQNLQEKLVDLELTEKDIENSDLLELRKFKKLEKLSFSYSSSNNLNSDYLKEVVEMKSLKEVRLEAIVRGQLDLNMACLLCVAPPRLLTIYDDYSKSISDSAFNYLSKPESLSSFTTNLTDLYWRSSMKEKMAIILKNVNWEYIKLDQCQDHNALHFILKSGNLDYTLNEFVSIDSEVNWEDLFDLRLSRLKIEGEISSQTIASLSKNKISKFLQYLFLEFRKINYRDLLETNLSQVDSYGY